MDEGMETRGNYVTVVDLSGEIVADMERTINEAVLLADDGGYDLHDLTIHWPLVFLHFREREYGSADDD